MYNGFSKKSITRRGSYYLKNEKNKNSEKIKLVFKRFLISFALLNSIPIEDLHNILFKRYCSDTKQSSGDILHSVKI